MGDGLSQNDIDALLAAASADGSDAGGGASGGDSSSASHAPTTTYSRSKEVRTVDFSRPNKFNKDQMRAMHMLHEGFCRRASTAMSSVVRALTEIAVESVEQVPFSDFVDEFPSPSFNIVLDIQPLGTAAMLSADLPLVFTVLDRMLGGQGGMTQKLRELTEIEMNLSQQIADTLVSELNSTWNEAAKIHYTVRGVEMNAQFAQVAGVNDPSVVIKFKTAIGRNTGNISLCLPFRSIEEALTDLSDLRFRTGEEDTDLSKDYLSQGLNKVAAHIQAIIGQVDLPITTVLGLQPGDVVPLGTRIEDGMELHVGGIPTWKCQPGRDGKYMAVRLRDEVASQMQRYHGGRVIPQPSISYEPEQAHQGLVKASENATFRSAA